MIFYFKLSCCTTCVVGSYAWESGSDSSVLIGQYLALVSSNEAAGRCSEQVTET